MTATAIAQVADADVADGLPFGFVLRDLAIARLVSSSASLIASPHRDVDSPVASAAD